nr:period clock protein-like [Taeniopygia guttata]
MGTGRDMGMGTGTDMDAGRDTGMDTGTGTGMGTGTDMDTGMDMGMGMDTGTDMSTDTGTGTGLQPPVGLVPGGHWVGSGSGQTAQRVQGPASASEQPGHSWDSCAERALRYRLAALADLQGKKSNEISVVMK